MRGTLISDDHCLAHDTGPGHPESPRRIEAVLQRLRTRRDLSDLLDRQVSVPASDSDVLGVHSTEYVGRLCALSGSGGLLDEETPVGPGSYGAAVHAAGAGCAGIDAVSEHGGFAFCLVRPPGHHAHRDRGGGFCLLNNAAIAAERLRRLGLRVFLLDWDLHHGDGTQEIFYHTPDVFYASMHEDMGYPGTGAGDEIGIGEGLGTTANIPFPPGTGEGTWLRAFDEVLAPVACRFRPDWFVVSAGFDAHMKEPLGRQLLRTRSFALLSRRVRQLAADLCDGRVVLTLEGGYDLPTLADCVEVCLWELCGERAYITDTPPKPDATPASAAVVTAARRRMRELWDI